MWLLPFMRCPGSAPRPTLSIATKWAKCFFNTPFIKRVVSGAMHRFLYTALPLTRSPSFLLPGDAKALLIKTALKALDTLRLQKRQFQTRSGILPPDLKQTRL
jgi:hypothetical protein